MPPFFSFHNTLFLLLIIMRAVSSIRSRIKLNAQTTPASQSVTAGPSPSSSSSNINFRRRACTSGGEDSLYISPPPTTRRAWAVVPRKLRGLHPAPTIIYVRENPVLVTQAMDRLYGTLVNTYNMDAKDIRVTDVPTAFDLPSAVRRMGKDRQLVIVVALLTQDKPWFDAGQLSRVRDYLLSWSQANTTPLVDGTLVDKDQQSLAIRICSAEWNVMANDNIGQLAEQSEEVEEEMEEIHHHPPVVRRSTEDHLFLKSGAAAASSSLPAEEFQFGHYLAHRAIEMFYIEHRGW